MSEEKTPDSAISDAIRNQFATKYHEQLDFKYQVLSKYIANLEASPAQRTKEWYAIKQKTIGGSEVATVLGLNHFSSVSNLIAEKIGITKFEGNDHTRWGTMFEPVTTKYSQYVLQTYGKIEEAPSIAGVIDRQRYSPDGLAVVQLGEMIYIILFEFKAPATSIPAGKIPEHYLPQVKTGLLTIPISDRAIFVNNSYRKCKLCDFNFTPVYDLEYHKGDNNKAIRKKIPLACGLLFYYANNANYSEYIKSSTTDKLDSQIMDQKDLIDFGESNADVFKHLMFLYDKKCIQVQYVSMVFNNELINQLPIVQKYDNLKKPIKKWNFEEIANKKIEKFKSDCDTYNNRGIGYLPWKLQLSDIIEQDYDPKWKETIEPKISETLKIIDTILSSDDPPREFHKTFPSEDTLNEDEIDDLII